MIVQTPDVIIYPSSDGKPMADNTRQYQWITTVKGGLEVVFRHNPNVFVAGDLLWYPVEGHPAICAAPDAMVVFGRPKGFRLSYKQWEEDNLPPQVVFEILSPSNSRRDLIAKLDFYDRYQVEEYYQYDPDEHTLNGWIREGTGLRLIPNIEQGWTSPRLQVHMVVAEELVLTGPDGQRFLTYEEQDEQRRQEKQRAEQEKQRAEQEKQRAETAEAKIQRLLDKLRAAGLDLNGES